jgi:hypothetical protein
MTTCATGDIAYPVVAIAIVIAVVQLWVDHHRGRRHSPLIAVGTVPAEFLENEVDARHPTQDRIPSHCLRPGRPLPRAGRPAGSFNQAARSPGSQRRLAKGTLAT